MNKPNLFIVGAARCGTTSLWQYLKAHPEIYMPEDELFKEPTFFSRDSGSKSQLSSYLSIFNRATIDHKWIGEASVAYLTDPDSAQQIFDFNPTAKIIIMLRNPAHRAFSLYNWMAQEGYEYASSFQKALKLEEIRVNQKKPDWFKPNYYWGYLYYRSSLYYEQVKRYLEIFKDKVLLIKFENFANNPHQSYQEICSFLKLTPASFPLEIHNPSLAARSAKILFILRKLNNYIIEKNKKNIPMAEISKYIDGVYMEIVDKLAKVAHLSIYEKFMGKNIKNKVADLLKNSPQPFPYKEILSKQERDRLMYLGLKSGSPPAIKKKIHRDLLNKCTSDIEKLSDLTGMDWSDWLKTKKD